MKITAIKQQVKQTTRYSIFVDEKYAFSLSESALITSQLHGGQELTTAELASLKDQSAIDKAYNRVLNLVVRRQRSEGEIRDYLRRKDYDGEVAEGIITRLRAIGLADDRAF